MCIRVYLLRNFMILFYSLSWTTLCFEASRILEEQSVALSGTSTEESSMGATPTYDLSPKSYSFTLRDSYENLRHSHSEISYLNSMRGSENVQDNFIRQSYNQYNYASVMQRHSNSQTSSKEAMSYSQWRPSASSSDVDVDVDVGSTVRGCRI